MTDYRRTLLDLDVNGHRVIIDQQMIDVAVRPDWDGAGPFVPGLYRARIDGVLVTPEQVAALLSDTP